MRIDLAQLEFIDRTLRKMVLATERKFYDLDFTITSLYRIGDPGVHGQLPLRGIDIRCKSDKHGKQISEWVNGQYEYDPRRPWMVCCLYHNTGLGKHLHFQVSSATVRRGVEV